METVDILDMKINFALFHESVSLLSFFSEKHERTSLLVLQRRNLYFSEVSNFEMCKNFRE